MHFYRGDGRLDRGVQYVLTTLLDAIRATVREVTQKQLLAASTILGPSAPVVQTVPEHPKRAERARGVGVRKDVW